MREQAEGILDIHSHILPKADDGSRYFGETAELLRQAYSQGVRGVMATPHYIHRHNRMRAEELRETYEKLKEMTAEALPDLELYLGAELFYFEGAVEALESKRVYTLNGTRYVLVEFPVSISYGELFRAVRNLEQGGYLPVLAHIERYRCLREDKGLVEELIQTGAYMQMNYGSLTGLRHPGERAWCRSMVTEGRIHLLGSDMHRLNYRPPELESAVGWLKRKGVFARLSVENPGRLLRGEPLER